MEGKTNRNVKTTYAEGDVSDKVAVNNDVFARENP